MNSNDVIVITSGESAIRIQRMTEAELSAKLAENYWGDFVLLQTIPDCEDGYFTGLGDKTGILVIRGHVVVPEAKEVVQTWTVPR